MQKNKHILLVIFGTLWVTAHWFAVAHSQSMPMPFARVETVWSNALGESRDMWVATPPNYSDTVPYPVIYVLDAEEHFQLVVALANELSASKKIPPHLVVGIPHLSMKYERVRDLTFSVSNVNPYGDAVLPPFFNDTICGGGQQFLAFLCTEAVPRVDSLFSTTSQKIILGHSLSGNFLANLLQTEHVFTNVQLYDPSIWYSEGEALRSIIPGKPFTGKSLYLSFQHNPAFHGNWAKAFHEFLAENAPQPYCEKAFEQENHKSIYLPSFLDGMQWLYADYRKAHFHLKKEKPYQTRPH